MKYRNIVKRAAAFTLSVVMAVTPAMTSFAEAELPAEEISQISDMDVVEDAADTDISESNVVEKVVSPVEQTDTAEVASDPDAEEIVGTQEIPSVDVFTEDISSVEVEEIAEVEEVIEDTESYETSAITAAVTEGSLGEAAEPTAKVYWGSDKNDPNKLVISAEPLKQMEYNQSGSFSVSDSPITPPWNPGRSTTWWTSVEIVLGWDEKPLVPLNMDDWFHGLHEVTSITGLSNLDTSLVTSMDNLFSYSEKLTSLELSTFETSKVTGMDSVFDSCTGLTEVNLSSFDTSNVEYMNRMFYGCSSLKTLDLSSFDTGNVLDMASMFYGCSNLETIYAGVSWTTKNVAVGCGVTVFTGCVKLKGGKGKSYSSSDVSSTYARVDCLTTTNAPGYFTLKEPKLPQQNIYYGIIGNELVISSEPVDANGWYISNYECDNPEWHSLSGYGNVTGIRITGSVKPLSTRMWFTSAESVSSIDLSGLDTSYTVNMNYMFERCSSLTELDLSGIDTSKARDVKNMFYECSSLISLDLSGFDLSNAESAGSMFEGTTQLKTIYVDGNGGLNIRPVSTNASMFFRCYALTGEKGSKITGTTYDGSLAHVDGGDENPGLFTDIQNKGKSCVILDPNSGDGEISYTFVETGSSYTLPLNTYVKDGFTFSGWSTSADGSVVYADGTEITVSEITRLYAIWEAEAYDGYKVTLNYGGVTLDGETSHTYYVEKEDGGYGYLNVWEPFFDPYTVNPQNNKLPDYWTDNNGNTIEYHGGFNSTIYSDVEYTLVWTENYYKITFDYGGVSVDGLQGYETYCKEGTSFLVSYGEGSMSYYIDADSDKIAAYWTDDNGRVYPMDGEECPVHVCPQEDMVFTLHWTSYCNLTFDSNDERSEIRTQSVPINTKTRLGNPFSYFGKNLIGWNTKRDGSGTFYDLEDYVIFTEPVTLYAQWGQYKSIGIPSVELDENGGFVISFDYSDDLAAAKNLYVVVEGLNGAYHYYDYYYTTTYSVSDLDVTEGKVLLREGLRGPGMLTASGDEVGCYVIYGDADRFNDDAALYSGAYYHYVKQGNQLDSVNNLRYAGDGKLIYDSVEDAIGYYIVITRLKDGMRRIGYRSAVVESDTNEYVIGQDIMDQFESGDIAEIQIRAVANLNEKANGPFSTYYVDLNNSGTAIVSYYFDGQSSQEAITPGSSVTVKDAFGLGSAVRYQDMDTGTVYAVGDVIENVTDSLRLAVYEEGKKYFEEEDNYKYIDYTGEPVVNCWKTIDGKAYYFGADGWMLRNGILRIGETVYGFDRDGTKLANKWFMINEGSAQRWLWFGNTGTAARNQLKMVNSHYYYFDENSYMLYGYADEHYERIDNISAPALFCMYYFGTPDDGARHTGWHILTDAAEIAATRAENPEYDTLSELKFYFDADGVKVTDTTITLNDIEYVFDENGVERTGRPISSNSTVPQNVQLKLMEDGILQLSFAHDAGYDNADQVVYELFVDGTAISERYIFQKSRFDIIGSRVTENSIIAAKFLTADHNKVTVKVAYLPKDMNYSEISEWAVAECSCSIPSVSLGSPQITYQGGGIFTVTVPGQEGDIIGYDYEIVSADDQTQIFHESRKHRGVLTVNFLADAMKSADYNPEKEYILRARTYANLNHYAHNETWAESEPGRFGQSDRPEGAVYVIYSYRNLLYKDIVDRGSDYVVRDVFATGKNSRFRADKSSNEYQVGGVIPGLAADIVLESIEVNEARWYNADGKWYFKGDDGNDVKNDWRTDGPGEYYLGPDGWMLTESFVEYDGNTYYVNETGAKVKDTVLAIDGYVCTFDRYGVLTSKEPVGTGSVTDPETGIKYITPQNLEWHIREDGALIESFTLPEVSDISDYRLFSERIVYDQDHNRVNSTSESRRFYSDEVYPSCTRERLNDQQLFTPEAHSYETRIVFVYDPDSQANPGTFKAEWYASAEGACPRKGSALSEIDASTIRINADNEVEFEGLENSEGLYGYSVDVSYNGHGSGLTVTEGTDGVYRTAWLSYIFSDSTLNEARVSVTPIADLNKAMSGKAARAVLIRDSDGTWINTSRADGVTVIYHGDGGLTEEGQTNVIETVEAGTFYQIKPGMFTKEGFIFGGWYRRTDAGNFGLAAGSEIKLTENLELWAHWKDPSKCELVYQAYYGDGTNKTVTVDPGTEIILENCQFRNEIDSNFLYWEDINGNRYNPGDSVQITREKFILYAIWEDIVIRYEGNPGVTANGERRYFRTLDREASSYTLEDNTFVNPGYVFDGWEVWDTPDMSEDPKIMNPGESLSLTGDINVIARWKKALETKVMIRPGSTWVPENIDKTQIDSIDFVTGYFNTKGAAFMGSADEAGEVGVYQKSARLIVHFPEESNTVFNYDSSSMFEGFTRLRKVSIQSASLTSQVTDMSSMFRECRLVWFYGDFDTHNVTSYQDMFAGCSHLCYISLKSDVFTLKDALPSDLTYYSGWGGEMLSYSNTDLPGEDGLYVTNPSSEAWLHYASENPEDVWMTIEDGKYVIDSGNNVEYMDWQDASTGRTYFHGEKFLFSENEDIQAFPLSWKSLTPVERPETIEYMVITDPDQLDLYEGKDYIVTREGRLIEPEVFADYFEEYVTDEATGEDMIELTFDGQTFRIPLTVPEGMVAVKYFDGDRYLVDVVEAGTDYVITDRLLLKTVDYFYDEHKPLGRIYDVGEVVPSISQNLTLRPVSSTTKGWYYDSSAGNWRYRSKDINGEFYDVCNAWKVNGSSNCFYYLGEDGYVVKNSLIDDESGYRYYVDNNGIKVTESWVYPEGTEGRKCWCGTNGKLAQNTTKIIDGVKYSFDENGFASIVSENKASVWLTPNREKVSWQQGRRFTVDIHVKDESGHAGGTFDVIWPADTFKLVGYEDRGYFGETDSAELSIHTGPIPAENGECVICYDGAFRKENVKGEGVAVTLIFEVVDGVTNAGDRAITFSEATLFDCVSKSTDSTTCEGTAVNVGKVAYGDIYTEDGAGVINTSDAAALERHLVHWDGYDFVKDMPEADINDDGYITSADVALLMRKITKWPEYEKYFE